MDYKNKFKLKFNLLPYRFYFDLTNNVIIDTIYRVDVKPCPFFDSNCIIQNNKFISCEKYPLNTCIDLGFLSLLGFNRYYFDLDEECSFIKNNKNFVHSLRNHKLKRVFPREFQANLRDQDIWKEIDKEIRFYKKKMNLNIIIDYKLKKQNSKKFQIYLNSWDHVDPEEYKKYLEIKVQKI